MIDLTCLYCNQLTSAYRARIEERGYDVHSCNNCQVYYDVIGEEVFYIRIKLDSNLQLWARLDPIWGNYDKAIVDLNDCSAEYPEYLNTAFHLNTILQPLSHLRSQIKNIIPFI